MAQKRPAIPLIKLHMKLSEWDKALAQLELADSQVPIRSMEIGIKIEFKPLGASTQTTSLQPQPLLR